MAVLEQITSSKKPLVSYVSEGRQVTALVVQRAPYHVTTLA
jgi:hypothetical protein